MALTGQGTIELAHRELAGRRRTSGQPQEENLDYLPLAVDELAAGVKSLVRSADAAGVNAHLIPYEESERIESEAETVWVITRHFVWNLYHPFHEIVKANLQSGKKYHYVYPREAQAQADQLKLENSHPRRLGTSPFHADRQPPLPLRSPPDRAL